MGDISLTLVAAAAGTGSVTLTLSTEISDIVLLPDNTIKIALLSNISNIDYSINVVSGPFDGTYVFEDLGYTTQFNYSVVKVLTLSANTSWNSTAIFKIIATSGDQIAESNEFTVTSTGSPINKTVSIDTDSSTLIGLDNSLDNLQIVLSRSSQGTQGTQSVQGQQEYTTPGTYQFVVPAGVEEISAVAIGGGGAGGIGGGAGASLAYNTFSVTPGETLTVVVASGAQGINEQWQGTTGTPPSITLNEGEPSYVDKASGCPVFAKGGRSATWQPNDPRTGDSWTKATNNTSASGSGALAQYSEAINNGQTMFLGGDGGWYSPFIVYSNQAYGSDNQEYSSAGGGAGGYSDRGGAGVPTSVVLGSGTYEGVSSTGAGGGGGSSVRGAGSYYIFSGAGGGVGIYGAGDNGAGGTTWNGSNHSSIGGRGGSGGLAGDGISLGALPDPRGFGGNFGGGGVGIGSAILKYNGRSWNINQDGGDGAVRLIWGAGRAYPSTNTQDVEVITQADLNNLPGEVNDTPAITYQLNNALQTVSLPRSITTSQFKRGIDTVSINLPIQDDPQGTEGTNIGTFSLEVLEVTDGYVIDGNSTVGLTINSNPNQPVREVFIDEINPTITINQGNTFSIRISRNSTRNGEIDNTDSVTLSWSISTDNSKFVELSGLAIIESGQNSTNIIVQTSTDFSTPGNQGLGLFTLESATSNIYQDYTITSNSINLEINDIYKFVEIADPVNNIIEITEGQTSDIVISSYYELNGVTQIPENTDVFYTFSNKDQRIATTNGSIAIDTPAGLGKIGVLTIESSNAPGFQPSINTIFKLISTTNNYAIGENLSKIIKILDSSNTIKTVDIVTNNLTVTEGNDIVITIRRTSTADGIDNYNDGGLSVGWRIIGGDSRYSLTSGVANFTGTDRDVIVTIPTADDGVGQGNNESIFEIYNPTNTYVLANDPASINITLEDDDPFYNLTSDTSTAIKGDSIDFTLTGNLIPNGPVYPYLKLSNGSALNDFTGNISTRDAWDYTTSSSTYTLVHASDGGTGAIAVDGNRMVVGDRARTVNGVPYTGQVHVWVKQLDGTWSKTYTLQPSFGRIKTANLFGYSVDISGDRIVVGAPGWDYDDPVNSNSDVRNVGEAYVYVYNSDADRWDLETQLPNGRGAYTYAGDAGVGRDAGFGASVAIDGGLIAISAPYTGNPGTDGKTVIYKQDPDTFAWSKRIETSIQGNGTCSKILLKNNRLIIASPRAERFLADSAGQVNVYDLNDLGSIIQFHGVIASGVNGGDLVGYDIGYDDSDGVWLAISKPGNNQVLLYQKSPGTSTNWSLEQTLTYDSTAYSVKIDGRIMCVALGGENYIYKKVEYSGSAAWELVTVVPGLNAGPSYAEICLAISDGNILKTINPSTNPVLAVISPSANSTAITVNNNSASLTITTADGRTADTDLGEQFSVELWSDVAPNGELLASSTEIDFINST